MPVESVENSLQAIFSLRSLVYSCSLSFTSTQVPVIGSVSIPDEIKQRVRFNELASLWKRDTRFTSSLTKMMLHEAYQAIIGMGKEALPFIFADLKQSGDHWLWALRAITQEDPVPEGADYRTAVEAWLAWGREHRYL